MRGSASVARSRWFPSSRNPGQSSGATGAEAGGALAARPGQSTATRAATTRTSAVHSAGPGRSPSTIMPANTPSTGTGSDDIDDIVTGSVRASVYHYNTAAEVDRLLEAVAERAHP